ncbi:MAG: nucleotidyltransferase substrate binding protein [Magnetococcales bacterium]|nr:nucleotidyltransferase substrate binding protein [Magnetococcales bacterium]
MRDDIRWKQRFANFDRAFVLLREVQERGLASLSQMEKEGAIQRFEFAFELAWKTLKDYLENQGIRIREGTPRKVIKEAFSAGMLEDAQVWMDMLHHRNLLSHTYDFKAFDEALRQVSESYFVAFDRLHAFFLMRLVEDASYRVE